MRTLIALLWLGLAALVLVASEHGPDLRLLAAGAIGISVIVAAGVQRKRAQSITGTGGLD